MPISKIHLALLGGILLLLSSIYILIIPSFTQALLVKKNTSLKLGSFDLGQNINSLKYATADYPSRLVISSLKLDKEIKLAQVVGGIWEIHDDYINFGLGSSLPQETGNTVLFAHARKGLFISLNRIKLGEKIELTTNSGKTIVFAVTEKKIVKPDDLSILQNTSEKTLTLFTCIGFANSKRYVVVAKGSSTNDF